MWYVRRCADLYIHIHRRFAMQSIYTLYAPRSTLHALCFMWYVKHGLYAYLWDDCVYIFISLDCRTVSFVRFKFWSNIIQCWTLNVDHDIDLNHNLNCMLAIRHTNLSSEAVTIKLMTGHCDFLFRCHRSALRWAIH